MSENESAEDEVIYYTLPEIAIQKGVTRQAVAYQVRWRKLGIKTKGRYLLTESEVESLVFRRPNQ